MTTTVKLIKKKKEQENNNLTDNSETVRPAHEPSTREVVRTIKSWVTEFQDRKRHQTRTLPDFPVVVVMNEQMRSGPCVTLRS